MKFYRVCLGDDIELPTWWRLFSVQISNLVKLLNVMAYKYLIGGSAAVALLAYFYNPELLLSSHMKKPNDCDVYIIVDDFSGRTNFITASLYNIGGKIDGYSIFGSKDTKTQKFITKNDSDKVFNNIDVLLSSIKGFKEYVIKDNINIITPAKLLEIYNENKRKNKNNNNSNNNTKYNRKLKKSKTQKKSNNNNKNTPKLRVLERLLKISKDDFNDINILEMGYKVAAPTFLSDKSYGTPPPRAASAANASDSPRTPPRFELN